jgi:hypothetical protein
VAVTKTQPVETIREALAAGLRELGENYVQEAEQKLPALPAAAGEPVTRHLIGHLQRNKAAKAAALFEVVQSVDGATLARSLGRHAVALGRTLDVLIQVNISGEGSKSGVAPDDALPLAEETAEIPGLRLRGLMGIGPLTPSEAGREAGMRATRESFRTLARLFEQLPPEHREVLSMGMSGDFELAIAEGSTMVRIGTGIFGARRSSG